VALDRLGDYALPNLMKKIVEHAIRNGAIAQSSVQGRAAR
jgi:citrate lyase alpha subunit